MGMQHIIQQKNTTNLLIKNYQDDNRCPSVYLKFNIAQWLPWFTSNLTLHNDLKIPFVHEEITLHANKYKLRTTGHSNKLINELFHQSNDVRRLQRTWPEDLAR
jgi:hypothetical protein